MMISYCLHVLVRFNDFFSFGLAFIILIKRLLSYWLLSTNQIFLDFISFKFTFVILKIKRAYLIEMPEAASRSLLG